MGRVTDRQRYDDRWAPKREDEFFDAQQAVTYVERAAAQRLESRSRLDVRPWDVVTAAERLWGRTLEAEREHRAKDRAPKGASPRTLQAVRGLVVRQLDTELREAIEDAADRAAAKAIERQEQKR